MKGHKFLKVTGILMIIAAVFSIIAGGLVSPVPFRVVDQRAGIDIDIAIRCFGEYSYRISDPILFYTNVCGNVSEDYTRDRLDGQLKTELLTALQPAFAKISDMGIRLSLIHI